MRNVLGTRHSLPYKRKLTIIAQDPSIRIDGRILMAEVDVPAEKLAAGPCGHRINVIDYDATTNILYDQAEFPGDAKGKYDDPIGRRLQATRTAAKHNKMLLGDPRFHQQNVYAIVMRTLARFEFALGRRVAWGSDGHQLHIAPHAFADANAFYSKNDRGIFFGYFAGRSGEPVFTCLSHDVVAHETTHALLDGLRGRYMEPSSADQAAFHEGFADIVALLSIFSLKEIVGAVLDLRSGGGGNLIDASALTREALKELVLLGLAKQMGDELSPVRGQALRRSVELVPTKENLSSPEFQEPHRRGELIVAAVMNAFLDIWLARLERVGVVQSGKKDRSLVVEEGALVADHLLTMAIRALDYCPPVDITFSDYLSALLTIDREVVPDDTKFSYRDALLVNFMSFGIKPAGGTGKDGTWSRCSKELIYSRTHFDSLLRDSEEVFRFIWENRDDLEINPDGYVEVQSVRPCTRIGTDGFTLRETVAEYVQILTLRADELPTALKIKLPPSIPRSRRIRIFGGGALIFDEYGQLKYQIRNRIEDSKRQQARLDYLVKTGFFDQPPQAAPGTGALSPFALLHLQRAAG